MYKSFEEMPVWQLSMDLAVKIFNVSEKFPKKEDYSLTSQIRRSASSIPANIAEGFGRYHSKDKINFYYYSRGSIMETKNHLIYAERVKYLDKEMMNALNNNLDEIQKSLNKIIKALRSSLS